MSYVRQSLGALSKEQEDALVDFPPEDIRQLPLETRAELAMRQSEIQIARKDAFWNAAQGIALGVIPILGFLGVAKLFKK